MAGLEAVLGRPAIGAQLKSIDRLDAAAAAWIAAAPLAAVGSVDAKGAVDLQLAGGPPGFALASPPDRLELPLASLDRPAALVPGLGVHLVFFVPGITETLRIGGRVGPISAETLRLDLDECLVHCGKALIRSDFFTPAPEAPVLPDGARFALLATADAAGRVETSPKGDPAGFLLRLEDGRLALPDRLGNRLAFGHRNILAHDRVALIAFQPGRPELWRLSGRATLSAAPDLLARLAIDGRAPRLVTLVRIGAEETTLSPALAAARFWEAGRVGEALRPDPAATLVGHIRISQARRAAEPEAQFPLDPDDTRRTLAESYAKRLY